MTRATIFHNPRCSKSRATLQILRDHEVDLKIIEYLKEPPQAAELDRILTMLGIEPRQIMRKGEPAYKQLALNDQQLTRTQLLEAIVANPILMERPVVCVGDKAVIGRPPELVLDLI